MPSMHEASVGLMDGAVQQQAATQPEEQSSGFNAEAATGTGQPTKKESAREEEDGQEKLRKITTK